MMINQQSSKLLHRLDRYLLLHYPRLWALQIHRILYISLLETAISGAILLLIIRLNFPFGKVVILGLIIIMLVIVIISLVHITRRLEMYNIEREFGNFDSFHGVAEIFIYFISAVIIILPLFCLFAFTNYKLSHTITYTELNRNISDLLSAAESTVGDLDPNYLPQEVKKWLGISLPKSDFVADFLTGTTLILLFGIAFIYFLCEIGLLTILTIISSLFALFMFEKAHAVSPFPKFGFLFLFFTISVIYLEIISIIILDNINIPPTITFFFFTLLNGFLLFKIINRNLERFIKTTASFINA